MNPRNLSVRVDRDTGDLWLTEEKYRQPIRKVANITAPEVPMTATILRQRHYQHEAVVRMAKEQAGLPVNVSPVRWPWIKEKAQ